MSASTIFIKPPLNYQQSLHDLKARYKKYSPFFSVFFWSISSVYAASKSSLTPSAGGLRVNFLVSDLLVITLASILLHYGIVLRRTSFTIPWIILSITSLYYNHYLGLIEILNTLKTVKKISWLPWGTFISSILLLIIRGTLTIRIFQLCTQIWFKQKLKTLKSPLETQ